MNKLIIRYFELENGETPFGKWLLSLDKSSRLRIVQRIERISNGAMGDNKCISKDLWELRFMFNSGYRIYCTKQGNTIIILLNAGDKSSQKKDIEKAKEFINILKGQNNE